MTVSWLEDKKKNPREVERGRLVSVAEEKATRELEAAQSDRSFLPPKGEGHR